MNEILLAYQIIEAGDYAYQLYSNWESDIAPEKFRTKVNTSDQIARVGVVGLGGAGKTTLIKTLTGCDKIDPKIATRGICPIILGREDKAGWFGRTKRTSIVYCDTEGQRPQDFVKSMLDADENEILHSGCFDGFIFVVDVKAPAEDLHRDEEIVDAVDWRRLDEHVQEWSDIALSLLFSVVSERLKLCVVFINKCNLVKELSGQDKHRLETKILDVLSPLVQRLQRRMRGVSLKVVMGSGRDIEHVSEVRRLIDTRALAKES